MHVCVCVGLYLCPVSKHGGGVRDGLAVAGQRPVSVLLLRAVASDTSRGALCRMRCFYSVLEKTAHSKRLGIAVSPLFRRGWGGISFCCYGGL